MFEKKTEHQYCKGYPGRFRREVERGLLGHALHFAFRFVCLAFVLACGAVTLGSLLFFLGDKCLSNFLALALFSAIFLWLAKGLWAAWIQPDPGPRILPYFQKISNVTGSTSLNLEKLGDIDTYLHGYAVARKCQVLDNMAAQLNLRELSDFGFNDDFRGERPTWHPPEAGLPTITGLRQRLRRKGAGEENSLDKLEEVIADLERIDTALCKARDKNVPFCFILRTTHSTNKQEHEQRLGFFF